MATASIYLKMKMKDNQKGFSKQSIFDSHGKVTCEAKTIRCPIDFDPSKPPRVL